MVGNDCDVRNGRTHAEIIRDNQGLNRVLGVVQVGNKKNLGMTTVDCGVEYGRGDDGLTSGGEIRFVFCRNCNPNFMGRNPSGAQVEVRVS